jgi:nucleoside transporter
MTATTDSSVIAPQSTTLPTDASTSVKLRLSIMMFLQYAIWGAWLPLFFPFLTEHRHLRPIDAGMLFSIGAIGALVAPFVSGQIADRWFNTERFLGISHLLGAALVWQLANVQTWAGLLVFSLLYSLIYAPTLSLTNAIAFHHLPDRDRDFGKVRVWGTVGWIVVGIAIGQWLLYRHTPAGAAADVVRHEQVQGMGDAFRVSAILGVILGLFCFFLPKTPPARGTQKFAPLEALGEVKRNPLLMLFLIAFPISCVHQFYFVHTAGFLGELQRTGGARLANSINRIFGVGGGGLMTIGQISEILVLAAIPFFAKRLSRKTFLAIGIVAYILRFFVFAYVQQPWAVIPALALHGLCFGCFFFIAFMIVDENTTGDVRASAQGLFNLVVVGLGVIVGNYFAGEIAQRASTSGRGLDFRLLFSIPMWICVGCLVLLLALYPGGKMPPKAQGRGFDVVPQA